MRLENKVAFGGRSRHSMNRGAPSQSREWPESALYGRRPTKRRMGEDAPHLLPFAIPVEIGSVGGWKAAIQTLRKSTLL
jgi:hypothetical protein